MADVLDITYRPPPRDSIVRKTIAAYAPLTQKAFGNNDVIRFTVSPQHQGLLLCDAYLHIQGKLVKADDKSKSTSTLSNNAFAALFTEVRIDLNGKTVDATRNVSQASALKTYVSYRRGDSEALRASAWTLPEGDNGWLTTSATGSFEGCLPLSRLMGFCEDHKRAIFNATVDLQFVRARNDYNAISAPSAGVQESIIVLDNVELRIPQIVPDLDAQEELLATIADDEPLPVCFRSWEMINVPSLEKQTSHSIVLGGYRTHPVCALIGFQTGRLYEHSKDASQFDHIYLRDIRLHVDDESYPKQPLNIDFAANRFADAYQMYKNFQQMYYQKDSSQPLLSPDKYMSQAPVIVIDTSHHQQDLTTGPAQIRLVFETSEPVADKTAAYILLIFDATFYYKPLSKQLNQA